MVKTPRTRHSRTGKEPVTIDLAPDDVSRVQEAAAPADKEADRQPVEAGPSKPEVQTKPSQAGAGESSSFGRQPERGPAAGATPRPSAGENKKEPPAPPSGRSRGGALLAGLVGGVAALALAAGLQLAGMLPQLAPMTAPEATDHGPAIAALETQLGALRQEITSAGGAGDEAALAARLAEAETQVKALAAGLDSLRAEVSSLVVAPVPGEAASADLAPIETRLTALEAAVAALPDISATETEIAALRSAVETGQTQTSSRLDAVDAAIQALGSRVDKQEQAPATALIIAASSLKAAIDRGAPFVAELDTYAALAPDAPQLAGLRDLAVAGVPTRAQIVAGSDGAANAMIAAARPVDPQAGIADRLWGSMMGLVQVRPIGMVEGTGVPEIVARLDAAVQAGDYERALAEYDTLPPEAKAAGAAFIARLRARHAADQLADEALAAALKA